MGKDAQTNKINSKPVDEDMRQLKIQNLGENEGGISILRFGVS